MIQIVGKTDIYFNSNQTFLADIKYHLTRSLEKYEIISHHTDNKENKMKINFYLNMNEKYECKSLLDYNSYAYDEFKKRLPSKVHTTYIQTIDIRPVGRSKSRKKK
ncbi:hypothetical protein [Aquibacillus rhizosphaerae]|uniref:Uncharacterized protein n=1 Tax=Aquibacillus rhizosphaerae TaxID=3051431 RepID=A0ABT7L4V5_9BACI|nr:hypothetical protein [Aquibacillus sp. LR5S19]MDL4840900.1 hypothetical protein [Aquibacillus sp. LR5S19]